MGTMVEVTNLLSEESVIVRINDRGPYVRGRIIDLSIGVAEKLDFTKRGVIPVRVEVLEQVASPVQLMERKKEEPEESPFFLDLKGLFSGG